MGLGFVPFFKNASPKFGKIFILPNYLWISSIDTAPYFWYAHIRN